MTFYYGFYYKDIRFAWKNKELYRLPFSSGTKTYGLKKLNQIMIGNKVGYRILTDKRTITQLQAITTKVDWKINLISDKKDLPF